jgi:hypothetical protein
MKFLKILVNSLLAGFFSAALLSLIIADLNIHLEVTASFLGALMLRLALIYGLFITAASIAVFLLSQFLSSRERHVDWLSPSFLVLGSSLLLLAFVILLRANYSFYFSFFDLPLRNFLRSQMIGLLFLAILGLSVYYGLRRRPGRDIFLWACLAILVLGPILAFIQRWQYPMAARPAGGTPLLGKKVDKKITVIGLEGLTADIVLPLVAQGKLPNFSWLVENGASARLSGFSPNERAALDGSFGTGKMPAKHRRLSEYRYRLLKMRQDIEIPPRYIFFKQLARLGLLELVATEPASSVKEIWQIFEGSRVSYIKLDRPGPLVSPVPGPHCEKLLSNIFNNPALEKDSYFFLAKNAFYRDCLHEARAAEEAGRLQPGILYFMLDGLNTVESYFYKFGFPQQFGAIDQVSMAKYGPVIEKYHDFYDGLIGKYLTGMKEDQILVVFSPHGTEPLPVWRRYAERLLGDPNISAYHEAAPDGFVLFYGQGVSRGKKLDPIRIVDMAPTLLYYLGLPVGRDMDGIVISSLFTGEFIAENPIIYISSYEDFRIIPPQPADSNP